MSDYHLSAYECGQTRYVRRRMFAMCTSLWIHVQHEHYDMWFGVERAQCTVIYYVVEYIKRIKINICDILTEKRNVFLPFTDMVMRCFMQQI